MNSMVEKVKEMKQKLDHKIKERPSTKYSNPQHSPQQVDEAFQDALEKTNAAVNVLDKHIIQDNK